MTNWYDQQVRVSGGSGFLGYHVVEALRSHGCQRTVIPRSGNYDLVDGDAA